MSKVSIIGAGNVGASLCEQLAFSGLCDSISLVDIFENVALGKAEDISHLCATLNLACEIKASKDYEIINDSDIVVVTAGSPRKEGMSRDDLLLINAKITKQIAQNIAKHAPNAIIIQISNPLDAMVHVALKYSGFEKSKVLGMAGVLDSARMRYQIQKKLGFKDIKTLVLGGHGDDMVPIISHCSVDSKPLSEFLTPEEIAHVIYKTKHSGANIVKNLGTSAYYAPAVGALQMINAILCDTKESLACAVRLDGEYGYKSVISGVPIVLGKNGVEKIEILELNKDEKAQFKKSVNGVYELLEVLEKNGY